MPLAAESPHLSGSSQSQSSAEVVRTNGSDRADRSRRILTARRHLQLVSAARGWRMPRTRPTPEPPTYTFRVRLRGGFFAPSDAADVWRELALAANQTLADLGTAIPEAFGFTDPHLWSFFLSGQPWDGTSEYALQARADPFGGPRAPSAARVRIDE